jgi:hypothetical protein
MEPMVMISFKKKAYNKDKRAIIGLILPEKLTFNGFNYRTALAQRSRSANKQAGRGFYSK